MSHVSVQAVDMTQPIRAVPQLYLSDRGSGPGNSERDEGHRFRYRARGHGELPHVMKFSGGRSSGMLLFTLLENGFLRAERGDVVVFNNTSCEHPETYRFAATCKEIVEQRYGVPFFWVEFQTYEDARRGEWTRVQGYRLVNNNVVSAGQPGRIPLAGRGVRGAPVARGIRPEPVSPGLHGQAQAGDDSSVPEGLVRRQGRYPSTRP